MLLPGRKGEKKNDKKHSFAGSIRRKQTKIGFEKKKSIETSLRHLCSIANEI